MSHKFTKKLHVLIVEDNPVDKMMLTRMLSQSPCGVFTTQIVDTLEDAFHQLPKHPFDAVLLDLNLSGSRGLTTLKKMINKFPDVPVVVNTGAYHDSLGLKAVALGAQDYLLKGKYHTYDLSKALHYAVERKKAEMALKNAYTKLHETESLLIQAEKMQSVGGVASGVAHEVKNPLATILCGIEFLKTKLKNKDEQTALTLESIRSSAQNADRMIKELLDFSGVPYSSKKSEDINTVIEHSLNLTIPQCKRRYIKVVKELEAQLPHVKIDKNRIEQVVIDIVLNSIQAMKSGGTLTVHTYHKMLSPSDNGWIHPPPAALKLGDPVIIVDVDDTGHGIAEDLRRKIFEPFFTTKRSQGGVGLGLSIAKTIMNSHNGHIDLANREGGGVRTRLILKVGGKGNGKKEDPYC